MAKEHTISIEFEPKNKSSIVKLVEDSLGVKTTDKSMFSVDEDRMDIFGLTEKESSILFSELEQSGKIKDVQSTEYGKGGKANPYYVKPISGETRKLFRSMGLEVLRNTTNGLLIADDAKTHLQGLYTQEGEEVAPPIYQMIDGEVNANGMTRVTDSEGNSGAIEAFVIESDEMARGGFVGKGERVWNKLTSPKRMEFLYENFTPEITPRSQELLAGKAYNFLPKSVKIKLEAKYANVEEYSYGDSMSTGGYVAIQESKDGYWTIASTPSKKEDAQYQIDLGVPRGTIGKVVTVKEAMEHKKVLGREYLSMATGGEAKSNFWSYYANHGAIITGGSYSNVAKACCGGMFEIGGGVPVDTDKHKYYVRAWKKMHSYNIKQKPDYENKKSMSYGEASKLQDELQNKYAAVAIHAKKNNREVSVSLDGMANGGVVTKEEFFKSPEAIRMYEKFKTINKDSEESLNEYYDLVDDLVEKGLFDEKIRSRVNGITADMDSIKFWFKNGLNEK